MNANRTIASFMLISCLYVCLLIRNGYPRSRFCRESQASVLASESESVRAQVIREGGVGEGRFGPPGSIA